MSASLAVLQVTVLSFLAVGLEVPGRGAEKSPDIGDSAPKWENLNGTDGKKHSLAALQEMEVVVVCFTCNTCPYAVDYEDRMIALQKKYKQSGVRVQLVAINSNSIAADHLDKMKERAKEKGFNFPYLRDEKQEVARAFGAVYTPEFFVLDRNRKIIYKGALDDSTKPDTVNEKYVESAVASALAGTAPKVSKTGARGCTIRFKRVRR